MVAQVNKLIYNALCKGGEILLPGIGSLAVRRTVATTNAAGVMVPPKRKVAFNAEGRGESIVDVIVKVAAVDAARAQEIYEGWLQSVKSGQTVTIEGVGVLNGKSFTTDQALLDVLNPAVAAAKPAKAKGGNGKKIALIVAAVLAVGLLGGGAWWAFSGMGQEPEPLPEPVVEIEQPVAEPEPVVVVDPDVERMAEGAHYAVWGVFSEKANALKYKAQIERRYPQIKGIIYHHRGDSLYLLALGQCQTRTACQELIWDLQELDVLFDDMWIFTNK